MIANILIAALGFFSLMMAVVGLLVAFIRSKARNDPDYELLAGLISRKYQLTARERSEARRILFQKNRWDASDDLMDRVEKRERSRVDR
jgi:hypothetical protein